MNTRAQLEALRDAKILLGGKRTTGQNIKDVLTALIDSLSNILDDKDQANGYLGIDEDGIANVSKIKEETPDGRVLYDNGSFDYLPTIHYRPVYYNTLDRVNTGTVEAEFSDASIDPATIIADGDAIEVEAAGDFVANATAGRTMKVYVANQLAFDSGAIVNNANADWNLKVTIIRESGANLRATGTLLINKTGGLIGAVKTTTSISFNSGIDNPIRVTGQASNPGAASNEIRCRMVKVNLIKSPLV